MAGSRIESSFCAIIRSVCCRVLYRTIVDTHEPAVIIVKYYILTTPPVGCPAGHVNSLEIATGTSPSSAQPGGILSAIHLYLDTLFPVLAADDSASGIWLKPLLVCYPL